MICPKCRTKYPEGVTVCPECGTDLIALLGEADAPADDDFDARKSRWKSPAEDDIVVPQTVEIYTTRSAEGFSEEEPADSKPLAEKPVKAFDEKDFSRFESKTSKHKKVSADENDEFSPVFYKTSKTNADASGNNALGVFFLVLSLLFMAASAYMFYMGRKPTPAPEPEITNTVAAVITAFFTF